MRIVNHLSELESESIYIMREVAAQFDNSVLIKEINQYDIGLYILYENLLNHKYCLPNKIFEFIQARLMIAITPKVDLAKLVFKYNVGCVSKDFSIQSMAEMLNGISKEQLQLHKNNTHKAAYDERDE